MSRNIILLYFCYLCNIFVYSNFWFFKGMFILEVLDICFVFYYWFILISVRVNFFFLFNFVNENYFFFRNNFDDLVVFFWYMYLYIINVLKENFYIWDIN